MTVVVVGMGLPATYWKIIAMWISVGVVMKYVSIPIVLLCAMCCIIE